MDGVLDPVKLNASPLPDGAPDPSDLKHGAIGAASVRREDTGSARLGQAQPGVLGLRAGGGSVIRIPPEPRVGEASRRQSSALGWGSVRLRMEGMDVSWGGPRGEGADRVS